MGAEAEIMSTRRDGGSDPGKRQDPRGETGTCVIAAWWLEHREEAPSV